MDLKTAVDIYTGSVRQFGEAMPLAEFRLPRHELEHLLAAWDEDYHLHRHFELIAAETADGPGVYVVNGLPYRSIVFKESIRSVFD